jgi:hypothetical protein
MVAMAARGGRPLSSVCTGTNGRPRPESTGVQIRVQLSAERTVGRIEKWRSALQTKSEQLVGRIVPVTTRKWWGSGEPGGARVACKATKKGFSWSPSGKPKSGLAAKPEKRERYLQGVYPSVCRDLFFMTRLLAGTRRVTQFTSHICIRAGEVHTQTYLHAPCTTVEGEESPN